MDCYIFPVPDASRPSYLHETGGLEGNWALDFMCSPSALVLSPVKAKVRKLSGSPPSEGVSSGSVFGYSLHMIDEEGYRYFLTHLSKRFVRVDQQVCPGSRLARVGSWPNDIPRTHLHLGVTSPVSEADAKVRIKEIAAAMKLKPA